MPEVPLWDAESDMVEDLDGRAASDEFTRLYD